MNKKENKILIGTILILILIVAIIVFQKPDLLQEKNIAGEASRFELDTSPRNELDPSARDSVGRQTPNYVPLEGQHTFDQYFTGDGRIIFLNFIYDLNNDIPPSLENGNNFFEINSALKYDQKVKGGIDCSDNFDSSNVFVVKKEKSGSKEGTFIEKVVNGCSFDASKFEILKEITNQNEIYSTCIDMSCDIIWQDASALIFAGKLHTTSATISAPVEEVPAG
jgi:hypothetical protein